MADAFGALESAIGEVTRARQSVMRRKTKQVFSLDEKDQLKSVAYAWFQTHRPIVAAHLPHLDLSPVDSPYHMVMLLTSRHAARNSYSDSLRDAKRSLVTLRALIASVPPITAAGVTPTTDVPPNFAPLASDPKMQAILKRRWDEVQKCIICKANLAATVMMGGLLESLLLARINSSPAQSAVFTAKTAARDKSGTTLKLPGWKLIHMVEVGHELAWISKTAKDLGNVLRDFRNYIHPHKEFTDGVLISEDDAAMFWEVTKAITRQVLASVGKSP
jgi:hypothetical protein